MAKTVPSTAKKGRTADDLLARLEDRHAEVLSRLDELEDQIEQALAQVGLAVRHSDAQSDAKVA